MRTSRAVVCFAAIAVLVAAPLLTRAQTSSSSSPSSSGYGSSTVPSTCPRAISHSAPYRPRPLTPCQRRCRNDIDCLLRCGAGTPAPPSPSETPPTTPSRHDILESMRPIDPRVAACRNGATDAVSVEIWFAGSGRVCAVRLPPEIQHDTAADCIVRAIRTASVPRFDDANFHFRFPFPYRFAH